MKETTNLKENNYFNNDLNTEQQIKESDSTTKQQRYAIDHQRIVSIGLASDDMIQKLFEKVNGKPRTFAISEIMELIDDDEDWKTLVAMSFMMMLGV